MANKEEGKDLVVLNKSAIFNYVKEKGFRVGADAYDSLNKSTLDQLDVAMERCEQNKRNTLRGFDF